MDMTPQCKMHMLWNTDVLNTCIVFRGWRITSSAVFVVSCIAILALSVFYEYLRVAQRTLDRHIARKLSVGKAAGIPSSSTAAGGSQYMGESSVSLVENAGLVDISRQRLVIASLTGTPVPAALRAARSIVYGITVFVSFFLMLVFMTYNAYLIAAVVIGATLGNYIFSSTMNVESILQASGPESGLACH